MTAVLVVLALVAGVFVVARAIRSDEQAGPWRASLWSSWPAGSIEQACEVGVCVGDTVVLPLGRPVEVVVDLEMAEELGALSVERVWTGERGGLFGAGWETVWDVRLVDGKFVGPLPADPVETPRRGRSVDLEGGATVQVDDWGRVDRVCLDAAVCTQAEWTDETLVLQSVLGPGGDEDAAVVAEVTLSLEDGVVSQALADDGRTVDYEYSADRLESVTRGDQLTAYGYEAGRLSAIDDGVRRTFAYDRSGQVVSASDRDGGRWTITQPDLAEGPVPDDARTPSGDVEVASPAGWTRTYSFADGALAEVVDSELGLMLRREISNGRVEVEERPLDDTRLEWVADDELHVQQPQDGLPGRRVRYWFDDDQRVVRTQTAAGTTSISYEGRSERPTEVKGPNGVQTFEYDRHGLVIATEDADGYRVEVERNESGQPTMITDGLQRSEFTYDPAGRVTQERTGDAISSATYRSDGLLDALTTPAGDQLSADYDDGGRLLALGESDVEPGIKPESGSGEADEAPAETVERSDGRVEQRYRSGQTVVLDEDGRPVEITVNGRTEARRYDDGGRLVEIDLPGLGTYELSYTPAGRVASVTDGAVTAELAWHGDLLVSVDTSAGTTYRYDYDEAGRVVSATSGPLRWDYVSDEAGRSSVVRGPFGVVQTRWDEQGRPVEVRDGGHIESYEWLGDGLDLTQVSVDGEEILEFARDDEGHIIEVTEAEGGTAELGYDPDTGDLNRYRTGDADELTLTYGDEGQVVAIGSDDRTETWTWVDGQVTEVEVDGEDDPYRLGWLAPGLLGRVDQGDDSLLRAEVDDAGRPTELWAGDDRIATLSWDGTSLREASLGDGPSATFDRDDEHRLVQIEADDRRIEWAYDDGALTSIDDGGATTSFDYRDGRLQQTAHRGDDAESTISWDPSRARPIEIDTLSGEVAFRYRDGRVRSIRVDGETEQVSYSDDQPTTNGKADDILDTLFSDVGRYRGSLGHSMTGPEAPWIESLPAELGISLPEVVTGREVVGTVIDEQLPTLPGFLLSDPEDLAERTALGLVAATADAPVLIGPDQAAPLGLSAEPSDLTLEFAGADDATAARYVADILAPGPGLIEGAVDFAQDVVGAVASGIGGGLGAIQRFVTENTVGRLILTVAFIAISSVIVGICGAVGVCALASGGLWVGEALITAEPGQALVTAVTEAALRPYGDLADAITSGDALSIVLSTATAVATLAPVAIALVRRVQPQAMAFLCGTRRVVCPSSRDYGPAVDHAASAQRNGAPRLLRIDRPGAADRRSSALRSVPTKAGLDRDEYPPAMSSQRRALSIQHVDPASNRALGAYVAQQLRGVPDGGWFLFLPIT